MIIKIPSKSLLFGEYGVLYDFIGIAFNSWTFHCEFNFQITSNNNFIAIYSDYFRNYVLFINTQKILDCAKILSNTNDLTRSPNNILKGLIKDEDELFFICALIPFASFLENFSFNLHITKYFSKSFGFGSSSAIISAIHLFFSKLFNLSEKDFWNFAKFTIKLLQGKGSGYDIAIQSKNATIDNSFNITNDSKKLWLFQNNNPIPKLEQIKIHGDFGYIVKTGIYSDTKKILQKFNLNDIKNINYAENHAKIAEKFMLNPTNQNANILIKQSLILQKSHNFSNKIIDKKYKNYTYKYLGAGKGDTIWVMPDINHTVKNEHILDKIIL